MKREVTKYNYVRPHVEGGIVYWRPCFLDMETGETVEDDVSYADRRIAAIKAAARVHRYKGRKRTVDYQEVAARYDELKTTLHEELRKTYGLANLRLFNVAGLVAKEFSITEASVYRIISRVKNGNA
jgi:hypothetical protein